MTVRRAIVIVCLLSTVLLAAIDFRSGRYRGCVAFGLVTALNFVLYWEPIV